MTTRVPTPTLDSVRAVLYAISTALFHLSPDVVSTRMVARCEQDSWLSRLLVLGCS